MFNSTFFKFLITFAILIGASFLIMGIAGSLDKKTDTGNSVKITNLK